MGQRLDEAAFSGVDVLTAIAAMHELCGGERFLIAVSSGVDVFGPGAGPQQGELLAGGFSALGGTVALGGVAVKLLARDDILFDEWLHPCVG